MHCDEFNISEKKLAAFKTAVTEPVFEVNTKYQSSFECKDLRNFLFTANVIPILSPGQRRVVVFYLSCARVGDIPYFEQLTELLENPVVPGLFYRWLVNWDKPFNPSKLEDA